MQKKAICSLNAVMEKSKFTKKKWRYLVITLNPFKWYYAQYYPPIRVLITNSYGRGQNNKTNSHRSVTLYLNKISPFNSQLRIFELSVSVSRAGKSLTWLGLKKVDFYTSAKWNFRANRHYATSKNASVSFFRREIENVYKRLRNKSYV